MQPLPQNKKDVIFQNFMLALFRLYRKERDVAYYARMQHITPRYFSTIIKEKSGNSALQWIVQMVITEAKQLLEGSDLSIKEIADQLNFLRSLSLESILSNMWGFHLKNIEKAS